MSIRGGFLNSRYDAGHIDIIGDPRDAPHRNYSPIDEQAERAEAEHARRTSALLMQRFRERALADNRWATFIDAIRALQLSPEQITAAVEELFAPFVEKAALERSATEEVAKAERIAAEQAADRNRIRNHAAETAALAAKARLELDAAEQDATEASRRAELLQRPEPDVVEEGVAVPAPADGG